MSVCDVRNVSGAVVGGVLPAHVGVLGCACEGGFPCARKSER